MENQIDYDFDAKSAIVALRQLQRGFDAMQKGKPGAGKKVDIAMSSLVSKLHHFQSPSK